MVNKESSVDPSAVAQNSLQQPALASTSQQEMTEYQYQRRDALLSQIQAIPVFTGTDPILNVAKFKQKFNEIASFLNWSEEEQFFALKQRLAGQAQSVLINYKEDIKNAKDVFLFLSERFEKNQDRVFDFRFLEFSPGYRGASKRFYIHG